MNPERRINMKLKTHQTSEDRNLENIGYASRIQESARSTLDRETVTHKRKKQEKMQ